MGSLPSPEGVSRSSTMGRGSRFAGMGSPRVVSAGRGPSANGMVASEILDPSTNMGCSFSTAIPQSASTWMGRVSFDEGGSLTSGASPMVSPWNVTGADLNVPASSSSGTVTSHQNANQLGWQQRTPQRRLIFSHNDAAHNRNTSRDAQGAALHPSFRSGEPPAVQLDSRQSSDSPRSTFMCTPIQERADEADGVSQAKQKTPVGCYLHPDHFEATRSPRRQHTGDSTYHTPDRSPEWPTELGRCAMSLNSHCPIAIAR